MGVPGGQPTRQDGGLEDLLDDALVELPVRPEDLGQDPVALRDVLDLADVNAVDEAEERRPVARDALTVLRGTIDHPGLLPIG